MKIKTAQEKLSNLCQGMDPESGASEENILEMLDEFCLYINKNVKATAQNWGKIIKNVDIDEDKLEFVLRCTELSIDWLQVLRKSLEQMQKGSNPQKLKDCKAVSSLDEQKELNKENQLTLIDTLQNVNMSDIPQEQLFRMIQVMMLNLDSRMTMKPHEPLTENDESKISSKSSPSDHEKSSKSSIVFSNVPEDIQKSSFQEGMTIGEDLKSEEFESKTFEDSDPYDEDSSSSSSSSDSETNSNDSDFEAYKRYKKKKMKATICHTKMHRNMKKSPREMFLLHVPERPGQR